MVAFGPQGLEDVDSENLGQAKSNLSRRVKGADVSKRWVTFRPASLRVFTHLSVSHMAHVATQ